MDAMVVCFCKVEENRAVTLIEFAVMLFLSVVVKINCRAGDERTEAFSKKANHCAGTCVA